MRQILFRGKRLDNGEWVYGYYVEDGFIHICSHNEDGFLQYNIVDPTTIGQFTGLLDRNGKEIYEGDIVRISVSPTMETQENNNRNAKLMGFKMPSWMNGGDIIARVSFFDTAYHFITISSYLPDFEGKQEPMLHYLFDERHPDYTSSYTHEITVVGNIHDNPELLKKLER